MNKSDNKSNIKRFLNHKPTYPIIPYPFLEFHKCKTIGQSNPAAGPTTQGMYRVQTFPPPPHLWTAQSAGSVLYVQIHMPDLEVIRKN